MNLQPFFILILAHFFIPGDKINPRKLLGLSLGFSGIAFVFLEGKGVSSDFRIGDVLILMSAMLWAVSAVFTKKVIAGFDSIQLALIPMIFASPLLLISSYYWDATSIGTVNTAIVLSLAYQSFVTASIGFVVWMALLNKYGAVKLHSFVFITPVSGVLLGGLVLNEPITYKIIISMLLIAIGLTVTNYKGRIRPVKELSPL